MKRLICLLTVSLIAALAGCGGSDKPSSASPATITKTQRDSVTASSRLPGAGGVKQALTDADSAAARAARLDAQSR